MKLFAVARSLTCASAAVAVPGLTRVRRDDSTNTTCVQQSDAEDIVAKFMTVMQHKDVNAANETIQDLLTDGFFESSDSINTLSAQTLGTVSFPTKADYVAAILHAPAPRNITTLKIMPAGCNHILWYWRMIIGMNAAPVQGFNLMEIENNKMASQYIEFNTIAWGVDIGFTVVNQGGKRFPLPGQVVGADPPRTPASAANTVSPIPFLSLATIALLGAWVV